MSSCGSLLASGQKASIGSIAAIIVWGPQLWARAQAHGATQGRPVTLVLRSIRLCWLLLIAVASDAGMTMLLLLQGRVQDLDFSGSDRLASIGGEDDNNLVSHCHPWSAGCIPQGCFCSLLRQPAQLSGPGQQKLC